MFKNKIEVNAVKGVTEYNEEWYQKQKSKGLFKEKVKTGGGGNLSHEVEKSNELEILRDKLKAEEEEKAKMESERKRAKLKNAVKVVKDHWYPQYVRGNWNTILLALILFFVVNIWWDLSNIKLALDGANRCFD